MREITERYKEEALKQMHLVKPQEEIRPEASDALKQCDCDRCWQLFWSRNIRVTNSHAPISRFDFSPVALCLVKQKRSNDHRWSARLSFTCYEQMVYIVVFRSRAHWLIASSLFGSMSSLVPILSSIPRSSPNRSRKSGHFHFVSESRPTADSHLPQWSAVD